MSTQPLPLMQQVLQAGAPPDASAPDGVQATHCPHVYVFHQTCGQARLPVLYQPGLVLLLSGEKEICLGAQSFSYNTAQGLLLTAAYPVLCTAQASVSEPLVGLYVALERTQVAALLDQVARFGGLPHAPGLVRSRASGTQAGITPLVVTPRVQLATTQLLTALADPVAARLFGPERSQALLYALLDQVPLCQSLARWIAQDGSYARFLKAIQHIQSHLSVTLTVQGIAAHAGMSESSLNRAFKRFASDAPMQYMKKLRLNQAHLQLQRTQCTVQNAAWAVGYESVSQFSREYKRYFGTNPGQTRVPQNLLSR